MSTNTPSDAHGDLYILGATRASILRLSGYGAVTSVTAVVTADGAHAVADGVTHAGSILFLAEILFMAVKALHRWIIRTYARPITVVNVYPPADPGYGKGPVDGL